MKGHVGGGSGLPYLLGMVWSVKAKPFYDLPDRGDTLIGLVGMSHLHIHT
jgi:hypothetical protein